MTATAIRKPQPARPRDPGEVLWRLRRAHVDWSCELVFRGESYGWEARVLRGGDPGTRGAREQVPTSVDLPFSDQTERILHCAMEEADRLDHKHVGTEHLLLGVLREDGSFAAGMLRRHGMTIDDLRDQIVKSPVVPEAEPETPEDGSGLFKLKLEAFDAVVSVERIRFLAEELAGSQAQVDDRRLLLDEIRHHLDALKRQLLNASRCSLT